MSDLQIKVTTPADVSGIDATTAAVQRLTAAEKENAKSAKDSADFFKQKLKPLNEAIDQQTYLAGLTQEAKATTEVGDAAEKTTSKKKALFDGLKKLGQEIPVVGYALAALKNPFTAIGVVAVLAARAVYDYVDAINKMADSVREVDGLQGRVVHFFEIIAQRKTDAAAFKTSLDNIAKAAQTASEWLKATNAEIDRKFDREEADAKKINPADPDADARNARKDHERAQALDNASRRAQRIAEDALAQMPKAQDDLAAAQQQAKEVDIRASAGDVDASTREAQLLAVNKEILGQKGKGWLFRSRISTDAPGVFRNDQELDEMLKANMAELQSIDAGRSLRQADRVKAQGGITAAEAELNRLKGIATTGTTEARNLRADAKVAFTTAPPLPQNIGTIDPVAQKAFDDHSRQLLRMVSDAQQAADAASRAADKAATAERLVSWMESIDARINALTRQSGLNQQNIR